MKFGFICEAPRDLAGELDVRGARCLARRLLCLAAQPRSKRSRDNEELSAKVTASFLGSTTDWHDKVEENGGVHPKSREIAWKDRQVSGQEDNGCLHRNRSRASRIHVGNWQGGAN